jgi:hypothetical protein
MNTRRTLIPGQARCLPRAMALPASDASQAAYDRQWPHSCRACQGTGQVSWRENQSPLGSGTYWPMDMSATCAECWEWGICPRCGAINFGAHRERVAVRVHVWWERTLYARLQHVFKRRGQEFGIAVVPWTRANAVSTLAYTAYSAAVRLHRVVSAGLPLPETPVTESCSHCGWTPEAGGRPESPEERGDCESLGRSSLIEEGA